MSNLNISLSERAYLVMHLHSVKYHNFDCMGVLIGKKEGEAVVVEDCVPLFHQRLMTGTCEVAFDMIQTLCLKPDQMIVGLYEAALPHNLSAGKEQTGLAQYLCEQLVSNFKDSIFV
jgi:hypothetical protein